MAYLELLLFAGVERGSRASQFFRNPRCDRVRAPEDAPRGPFCLLERRHAFADIVERGVVVMVERPRVTPPHPEREIMTFSENASRRGYRFTQQRLDFFEAL